MGARVLVISATGAVPLHIYGPGMSRQYIYTIEHLTKKHGPREVLKDIWLAFYPGAKIGVLGRNGAGKSTLLRIMAGACNEVESAAMLTHRVTRGLHSP